jgi:diacylglycerol kinase family enzyme
LDGGVRREGPLHDVIVANGRFHGGGMKLAPDARQDDGLFDIVLIGDVNEADSPRPSPKLYSGPLPLAPESGAPAVVHGGNRRRAPLPLEVDGEPIGATPCALRGRPAALQAAGSRCVASPQQPRRHSWRWPVSSTAAR